ncbi:MAG TPA: hypothetical protein VKI40_04440, partial [Terriglobales bacterium]|nr:hypothetical protein [Terriglobales bacterium]
AKLGLGNPALAPHRRLIDSTINRAGLRNLDGWERQLNLVTASQDDNLRRDWLCEGSQEAGAISGGNAASEKFTFPP